MKIASLANQNPASRSTSSFGSPQPRTIANPDRRFALQTGQLSPASCGLSCKVTHLGDKVIPSVKTGQGATALGSSSFLCRQHARGSSVGHMGRGLMQARGRVERSMPRRCLNGFQEAFCEFSSRQSCFIQSVELCPKMSRRHGARTRQGILTGCQSRCWRFVKQSQNWR